MKEKFFIGISSTFHDPSIAILNDSGDVLFAEGTERYLQNKRAVSCVADPVFRSDEILRQFTNTNAEFHIATTWSQSNFNAMRFLSVLGIYNKEPSGISKYFYKKMLRSMLPDNNNIWFLRQMYSSNILAGASFERNLRCNYGNNNVYRYRFDHHLSHAAYATYASALSDAACLIVDGSGEIGSISIFRYNDYKLTKIKNHIGYESLGYFYMLITSLCGFNYIGGEEWKVMGMAAYGKLNEKYYHMLKGLFRIKGCEIRITGNVNTLYKTIDYIKKELSESGNSFHLRASLAYTGQLIFEEYMDEIVNHLYSYGISDNLVYSGGCGLNSSYNGKILSNSQFAHLYIPSAPGDDGNAIGAACLAYAKSNPCKRIKLNYCMTPYLGSTISDKEIEMFIHYSNYQNIRKSSDLFAEIARYLSEGKIIGWIQGRAEFGPRALGNRSILADPRYKEMKDKINSLVKFREEFRPFAPSILHEYGNEYFENYQYSPYMERTLKFREQVIKKVPAVVHEDNTGRLQSVTKLNNEKYYNLINAFYNITGIPMILNTSFNVMGKPIVHSFNDALNVFFNSGLDVLVVNDYVILK